MPRPPEGTVSSKVPVCLCSAEDTAPGDAGKDLDMARWQAEMVEQLSGLAHLPATQIMEIRRQMNAWDLPLEQRDMLTVIDGYLAKVLSAPSKVI